MTFSIKAGTYTLKYKNQETDNVILDNKTHYVIPIYQRPYSWSEDQINKFITDIFSSFGEYNSLKDSEPMFIGTMQLSDKDAYGKQEIIDGQQRITTFFILLKALFIKYPYLSNDESINFNWLSSEVNNGEQQENLNSIIEMREMDSKKDCDLNMYLNNLFLIDNLIDLNIDKSINKQISFHPNLFLKHLLSNIYFVVIETHATLSKTLKIFDTINTTGLDLNAGDIFKIRMYEYLNKDGDNKSIFNDISRLYEKIDSNNNRLGYKVTDIKGILHIYHYYLVAKYDLPAVLYTVGSDAFYDRLFETMFNINKWEHFKNNVEDGKVKLSLQKIDALIDIRYEWEEKWNSGSYGRAINPAVIQLWWWSRYGRFWVLIFTFLNSFKDEPDKYEKLYIFTEKLVKLYTFYSIYYQKRVTKIYAKFNNHLINEIVNGNYKSVINSIDYKMNELNGESKEKFIKIISGDITYSSKVKNILCRLSAILEENYRLVDSNKAIEIRDKLFRSPIDIEHIQSYNNEDIKKRSKILEEWGDNLNSIGNLIVLEQSINRSIKNKENIKLNGYKNSKLAIVNKDLVELYPDWTLEECKKRKNREVKKIIDYIFSVN